MRDQKCDVLRAATGVLLHLMRTLPHCRLSQRYCYLVVWGRMDLFINGEVVGGNPFGTLYV
jgi:hypothetical protein